MTYYKGFEQDMTCHGFKYEVGRTYTMEEDPIICKQGFHCCKNPLNCLEYYEFDSSRFCEVTIGSNSITEGEKTVTNQITIVREIVGDELKELMSGEMLSGIGAKVWYLHGKLHRDDGPAVVWASGTKDWYQHGLLHRENDLPAIEEVNGDKQWYQHGKLHREDGPAIERADGTLEWYLHDEPHRDNDLPARELSNGRKEWYVNGKLHRDNSPAIEDPNGTKKWFQNGLRHRKDGPAIIKADGTKKWFQNDELHREDGPAIEYSNGAKEWWMNGKCHRDNNLPSIKYSDGSILIS
jgi:hypothetical protein